MQEPYATAADGTVIRFPKRPDGISDDAYLKSLLVKASDEFRSGRSRRSADGGSGPSSDDYCTQSRSYDCGIQGTVMHIPFVIVPQPPSGTTATYYSPYISPNVTSGPVIFSPSTQTSGPYETTAVVPLTNSATPNDNYQINAGATCTGTNFTCSAGPLYPFQVLCDHDAGNCPQVNIVDAFSNNVLASPMPVMPLPTTAPGLEQNFQAVVKSKYGTYAASSQQYTWAFVQASPPVNVKNVTLTTMSGGATVLTDGDEHGSTIDFFWTAGNPQDGALVAMIVQRDDGHEISFVQGLANLAVQQPVLEHLINDPILETSPITLPSGCVLANGQYVNRNNCLRAATATYRVGDDAAQILTTLTGNMTAGYDGDIGMTQLISRQFTLNPSKTDTYSTPGGALVLDQCPIYPGRADMIAPAYTASAAGYPFAIAYSDSPLVSLTGDIQSLTDSSRIDDYYMYRPHSKTAATTAFMPIGGVETTWYGVVQQVPNTGQFVVQYTQSANPVQNSSLSAAAPIAYPQYSNRILSTVNFGGVDESNPSNEICSSTSSTNGPITAEKRRFR